MCQSNKVVSGMLIPQFAVVMDIKQ